MQVWLKQNTSHTLWAKKKLWQLYFPWTHMSQHPKRQTASRLVQPFLSSTSVWRTDRETDRQTTLYLCENRSNRPIYTAYIWLGLKISIKSTKISLVQLFDSVFSHADSLVFHSSLRKNFRPLQPACLWYYILVHKTLQSATTEFLSIIQQMCAVSPKFDCYCLTIAQYDKNQTTLLNKFIMHSVTQHKTKIR